MRIQDDKTVQLERLEAPIPPEGVTEFTDFWRGLFGPDDEDLRDCYGGSELEHNRDLVYIARIEGRVAGTAHLTLSQTDPRLGGLGAVGTEPEFRGRGIATRLCALARDDFRSFGGEALFLGTNNPEAARVYARCDWRRLEGSNVWANVTSGASPETFLEDYFKARSATEIVSGSPAGRVGVVPLILAPHSWQMLDANLSVFCRKHALQKSCMSLYPRYESLCSDGRGAWFGARTEQGMLVGLSTARVQGPHVCQVDAFAHESFLDTWSPLIERSIAWARQSGAIKSVACVSTDDEDKMSRFLSLGFVRTGDGEDLGPDAKRVQFIVLEKTL